MICKMMDAGYIVAADDHVGHGKTAIVNDTWGNWGHNGAQTMMEDEHRFKELVQEKYPDIPYFMFGHSMGSIITRQFIAKYGDELAGAVICGTVGPDAIPCEEGIRQLKPLVEAGKGDEDPCGSYGEGVKQVAGWLEETGHRITTRLYHGYRHEIHNYNDIKDDVEAGIIAFMDEVLG